MEPVRIEILLNDRASQGVSRARSGVSNLSNDAKVANRDMQELDKTTQSMDKTFRRLAGAFAIKELVSKIATVRGEVQQLEVAFRTMLGSVSQADELLQQLVRTAAITPFGLEDVANGAKQLLAYGLEAEKVNETLIRLGDIAAGLSVPLNDLVYLYGTTMAQGRLYTQDLNQFTGRGIPMISELAKQFGVAESKVKELVEAGKVGFPEVQKVIESLTDEGGKFGGLMEEQSKTITGQISNIEDAVFMMFNEIGQQSEGIINSTLSGVSYMIENYERFGRILLALVGTYGVYRTAIISVVAMKGWATAAEALHYNWLLLVEKAQKMLNATMLANPYVLIATLLAGVCVALVSMKTETERLKEAEEDYQKQKEKVIEAEEEHRRKIEELCSIAGDEAISTDTRREALNKLEMKYPDIFAKYDTEYEKLKNIKKIKEEIAALDGQKSITRPENELASVNKRIAELEAKAATEHTVSYTTNHGTYTQTVGGLSSAEKAELKNLRNKRGSLQTQVRKNEVNAYFENLTGISNDTLAAEIKRRQDLLAKMKVEEKQYGTISHSTAQLNGTYSREELQYQLNKLQSEQNRRNKPKDSPADWVASSKKTYEDALKAYNDFIKDSSNSLSQEDFEKKAKALKDAVDDAKKEYDNVKPGTNKDAQAADRQRQKEERQRNARVKLGLELAELQRRNDDAEIEAMNEGTDKRLRQIENDYAKRRNEIARQEASWRKDNRTAGGDGELSAEQRSALDEASARNDEARDRAVREAYEAEYALMRDYLKEYGTFQERKLAIAEEYDAKIAKAGSEWERKRLEREKERDIRHVETEAVMQSVDWGSVFGDFSTMFRDQLEPTIEKLKAIADSGEFKGASLEDKKTLYDLIARLEQAATGWDSGIFRTLGDDLTAYQSAMRSYIAAQNDEHDATLALVEAKRRLAEAERNKDSNAIVSAKADVAAATEALGNASGAVREFGDKVQEGSGKLQESVRKAEGMFGSLAGSLQGLASGTLKGVGDALMGIDRLFNNSAVTNAVGGALAKGLNRLLGNSDIGKSVTQALGNSGLMGSMISAVLSILDVLKDGAGVLVSSLIDTVLGGVSGLIEHALDGSMFTQIGGSLLNGVKGILDSVTFGAVSSLFSSNNAAEVQGTIDRLTERNEKLQGAIEDLTDEIKDSKGTKSVAAYRQAYDMQKEVNANYLGMAIAQMGYSNKSHSWAHYWTERGGFTAAEKKWIRENVKSDLGNDIWSINSLSPEEMKKLRGNVGLWDSIWNTGKRGYGWEVAKKMDAYIDQAGKLEDLTSQLYEGLTGMTFDGMYSSFVDSLMDMKYDAQDAADDISEYFMKSMLSNKIGEIYSDRLKDWWSRFGESMEDGTLSEAERNSLQKEYMGYVEEAIKLRDSLAETIGYDPDKGDSGGSGQSGRAGVYTAMTQDQGTRLEGIGTSIQMHEASIDGNVEDVSQKMGTALDHLSRIEENTRDTAGGVRELNEKLDRIIRDGIRI